MTKGKNALVTGSTSGIGLAIAEAFCAAGMNVMLNGFGNAADVDKERARLAQTYGANVRYHGADMSKPAEIRDIVNEAKGAFGQLDILVNNAGIHYVQPIEDIPDEKWDAIIAINLTSAFHTIKHSIADMKARKWGRIINIASAHGLVASPFKPAYVAAKHGLVGLTKTAGLGCAEHGVTCNAICPGYVMTPLVRKQIPDQAKARGITEEQVVKDVLLASQATKQFVTIEQLGAFAVFLCTDAAAQITGAALPVDGGWTAHRGAPWPSTRNRSISPSRVVARMERSPGACSIAFLRMAGSGSTPSAARARAP